MTETAMADLVGWYNQSIRRYPWPLLVATELVFRFLAIHPFQDGNGRLGRALFILSLLQSDDKYWTIIVPFLAVDRHIEQNRSLYYTSLQRAAGGRYQQDPRQYDYLPVAWFFLKIIREALPDIWPLSPTLCSSRTIPPNCPDRAQNLQGPARQTTESVGN